jgi:hypothetical protein
VALGEVVERWVTASGDGEFSQFIAESLDELKAVTQRLPQ